MLMTKGNSLPNSDNSLYLRPAWENGYVGKFTNDCSCFCKGCNYTVLISSEEDSYITVGAKFSGQVVDLNSMMGQSYDSVLYYHIQWYSFDIIHSNKTLSIRLDIFAGDPDIYVNPNVIPNNLYEAAFNSKDHFENEELLLDPADRKKAGALSGTYYIGVFGKTAATYRLTIKNQDHSIFLKSSLSESGYLEFNKTKFYYFRDPILAKEDIEVDFQLHVMTGTARLKAKLCEGLSEFDTEEQLKEKCIMTEASMFEPDPDEKVMAHIGSEGEKTNTSACRIGVEQDSEVSSWLQSLYRQRQVSCAYIIGLAGLAPYTTHYSVLIKTIGVIEHTVLREGKPINDEIYDNIGKYYMISINDPNIIKLTVQMTTIHGDPDLFMSRTTKEPNYSNFEQRSVKCGIYPELLEIGVETGKDNMEGEYYIAAFSYTQSTFHLVYFVETKDGSKTQISLMNGIKQRGVMHSTDEHMVYKFRISHLMKEDIEIRLHAENGQFAFYTAWEYVPSPSQYDFKGDEHNPLLFTQGESIENSTTYYVVVVPQQLSVVENDQNYDSAGMAYVYTIAFYERGSFLHLTEGQPLRGSIDNETMDYYYIEVDAYDEEGVYELTLTPISGDPDIVISLNSSNQFPDKDNCNLISENNFSTDTFIISPDLIKSFADLQDGKAVTHIYVGVYTRDKASTYTLLYTKSNTFNTIQLTNGQIQTGSINGNQGDGKEQQKHYYFKTSSSMPTYATLIPKKGNPDMQIAIIKNLSMPINEWEQYVADPLFKSDEEFGADIIYLNPSDKTFADTCGNSCILLITVTNGGTSDTHYTISVTRDITELVENLQIQDSIRDFGQYRYYKFYKSCENCDLEIQVTPLQVSENLYLLADYEVKNKLPTHQNSPAWFFNIKYNGAFTIKHDDKYFVKSKRNISSKGTYIIALHGHSNISYTLSVHTSLRYSSNITTSVDSSGYLDIRKIYLGESQPFQLQSGQAMYFYFENWNNASLKVKYLLQGTTFSSASQNLIDMRISTMEGKRLPQYENEMPNKKWITQKDFKGSFNNVFKDTIQVDYFTKKINFCVQCYFIVRLENVAHAQSQMVRLVVEQDQIDGYGFYSTLVIGKPYNLRLAQGEQAQLSFHLGQLTGERLQITAQLFTGDVVLYLYKGEEFMNSSDNHNSIVSLYDKMLGIPTIIVDNSNLQPYQTYQLFLEAPNEDVHCSIIVQQQNDISILADGVRRYVKVSTNENGTHFLYIPPSRKFHLTVSAQFNSLNQSVKIFVKKLDIQHEEESGNYWSKYNSIEHFDYVLQKEDTQNTMQIFQMIPIELEDDDDLILIKLQGYNNDSTINEATVITTFFVSGSEIQYINAGESLRGVVSNKQHTYKIYEFYVNQNDLYEEKDGGTDLFIEVTPCNGRVQFFVSDDFASLFNNASYVSSIDMISFEKFGKTAKRLKNIQDLTVVYIGIESVNEVFSYFEHQAASEFEIIVRYMKSKQRDIMELYVFEKSNRAISIEDLNEDQVILKWSQIFKRSPEDAANMQILPTESVDYTIVMASDPNSKYQLGNQCQTDHFDTTNQTFQVFGTTDENFLVINKTKIPDMQVIGIFAYLHDDFGKLKSIAYEPTLINQGLAKSQGRHDPHQLYVMVMIGTGIVILLAIIAFCFRLKGNKLKKRLEFEVAQTSSMSNTAQEMNVIDRSSIGGENE